MPITLNHSNISVQYSSDKSYIIETVKSDLYRRNEIVDTIVRDNIQVAPVTPSIYIENGTNNVYAVESYTYSGSANTADFTRVFTKSTTCDILVVGGGGAGGGNGQGGGGGAGAVIYYEGLTLNGTYNIKTGKGANATLTQNVGDNGVDSEFLKVDNTQRFLAKGGGGGGTYNNASGYLPTAGGSGGGGAGNSVGATIVSGNIINGVSVSVLNDNYVNTNFTGNRGINSLNDTGCFGNKGGNETSGGDDSIGAGGGGAGEVGTSTLENQTGNKDIAGNGGSGKKYNISGVEKYYGGGGGGGLRPYPADSSAHGATSVVGSGGNGGGGGGGGGVSVSSNGFDAENGTGGGGGGVGGYTSANFRGGAGGSGIVIIRYLLGTIPATNYLTNEPVVIAPVFTETVRTFAHSGGAEDQTTYTITVGRDTICDILIVGGGGGGGPGHGGGGGAGQLILIHQAILNGTYTINVGKGGIGGRSSELANSFQATKGSNSTFGTVIAEGGGANTNVSSDKDGGSGAGGDGWNSDGGTSGFGNKNTTIDIFPGATLYSRGNNGGSNGGGNAGQGGGGGGAGAAAPTGSATTPFSIGGDGLSGISDINYDFKTNFGNYGKLESDGNYWFAGGGGGGATTGSGGKGGGGNGSNNATIVGNATNNTGSGGGGGAGGSGSGGSGGSGIVIIKFKSITAILEGITHKRLNFSYTQNYPFIQADNTNLKAWYKFDGNYMDSSPSGFNLTNSGATIVDGLIVQSVSTDASDFLETSGINLNGKTYSISFWAKFNTAPSTNNIPLFTQGITDSTSTRLIFLYESGNKLRFSHYGSGNDIDTTGYNISSMVGTSWHHYVITYNNTNRGAEIWFDGVKLNTNLSTLTNTFTGSGSFTIARWQGTTFNGLIEDFRYYDKVLTSIEITQLYNIPTQNTYTLNFQVPTIADINNNSNIVLRGEYDIALSTSNAIIISKTNQYIPKPTTFINYSVERMYPPVRNFTAATTAVSGQTYGNGTYVVTYSSTYGQTYDPFKCFNTSDGIGGAWAISRYTSGVFNSTSFIVAGYLGDWIKIQLPVAIRLTRFSILQRSAVAEGAPKDFKIYGSNDNINWVELVNKTDALYNASIYEQTTPEITNTYTYYGLVVNKLFGTNTTLNFDEWYIYGQELLPSSLSIRYNLLNPTLDPIGAQWTYSSNNTNVYHMGRVGIGTTSPEYQLDVRGAIYSSTGGYTSSTLTKWSVLSDRRIKENIVKASYDKCLENVKNIELYNFNFKDNCVNTNDRHQLGFIAQEVQQVYPKAVEVGKMIVNLEQKIDDLLTLNITQIDYTLYGAVKSLIEKIENIKIKMEHIKTTYDIP
jgi:hypothetical protein